MPVVGLAEVLVTPVFTGTQKKISRTINSTASSTGRSAGARMGEGMAEGFAGETEGLEKEAARLEAAVSKSQDKVASGKSKLTAASVAEQKAIGDLRVAELRLQETRDAGNAKASALATAEERVATAHARVTASTTRRESAERSLTKTQAELDTVTKRSTSASEKLDHHLKANADAAKDTERSMGRLGAVFDRIARVSPLGGMSQSVRKDSDRINFDLHKMAQNVGQAGTRGGRAFTKGFVLVAGGLSAVIPAAGAAGAALVSGAGNVLTLASSLGALAGVAGVVPAGLISVGASAGVLATAFHGVGDALKALNDEQDAFVANPRIAAMAVEDATSAITVAEQNAARAQVEGSRRVSDAKRALQDTIDDVAQAEQDAAKDAAAAARRVVEAQRSLSDAAKASAKAQQDAAKNVAQAARRVAEAQESVQDAVKAAEQAQRDAAKSVAQAARRVVEAQESVRDAVKAAEQAEQDSADAIVAATRRVRDAKLDLQDTIESVADAQKAAAKAVQRAERAELDSARDVTEAQQELTRAREDAAARVEEVAQRLQDADRRATESAGAYQRAMAAYQQARLDPNASVTQLSQLEDNMARALANSGRAKQAIVDIRKEQSVTQAEAAKGGAAVLAAEQKLADARQAQADAVEDREDAQQRVVRQQRDGARALADANENVADAVKAQKAAQADSASTAVASAKRVADAQRSVTDALEAQRDAQADAVKSAQDAARRTADAQQSLADALTAQRDAQADAAQAAEDSARRVADAQLAVTDAVAAERDARAAAAKVGTDGARRVADAQQALVDATADAAQSQADAARAVDQAYRNLERVQLQQADAAAQAGFKSKQAMDKLTPSAQEAVRALLTLRDTLDGVRRIAQENFFTGLGAGMTALVTGLLQQLESGVGAVATALNGSAKQLLTSVGTALGGGVLNTLLQGTATTITTLNKAIDPLVQSFVTLGVVGMQYMPRLAEWVATLADRFNGFVQATAADGRLVAWIDGGIAGLKDLWSIVSSVAGIFGDLTRAAEAGGAVSTLAGLASGLRDLDTAMSGSTFQTTMATIFAGAEAGAQGLLSALGPIGQAFSDGAPAMAEFLRLGGRIAGTFIGGIFKAASNPEFGAGLSGFLESLLTGVQNLTPLLPGLTSGFGAFLSALGPIMSELGPSLVKVFTAFGQTLGFVLRVFEPLLVALAGSPVVLGALIAGFSATAGAAALLTAAGNVQRLLLMPWRVAMFGLSVAQKAFAVGSKIATAAQWLFNAALRANPIGLVITAVTALVAGIVWFATKTEWGRNIVAAAWAGIQTAVGAVVSWWTTTAWPFLKAGLDAVGAGFTWLYQNVIKPVWAGIAAAIGLYWNFYVKPIFNAIVWFGQRILGPMFSWLWQNIAIPAFKGIAAIVSWAWNTIVRPIFSALNWFVRSVLGPTVSWLWRNIVSPAFQGISGAIGTAWSWIRDRIFAPLNSWMRGTLGVAFDLLKRSATNAWEGLRSGVSNSWNWIRDNIFAPIQTAIKTTIPNAFDAGVKAITKFWDGLKSAAKAPVKFVVDKVINPWLIGTFNTIGKPFGLPHIDDIKLPDGFARGGVLPGYQARKHDDVLTPMRSGEGVLVPEAVRALGEDSIHSINAAANSGGVAGARRLLSEGAAAGGPPGGPGGQGIWSSLQQAASRAGYMYFPKRSFLGVDTENAAKAWIGQSALDIRVGDGSPGIKQYVPGGSGGWGFYSGDTIWMQPNGPQTGQQKIGTLAHEMGHALSLMHTPGTDSIMNPMMQGGYWPHAGDYATLRRVWGEPGSGVKKYSASDAGQDGGGGFNPFSFLLDKASGLIKGAFPAGGWMVDTVAGGAKRTIQGAIDWVGGFLGGGITDVIGNGLNAGKNWVGGIANRVQVGAWVKEALNRKHLWTEDAQKLGENRAFQESSGNPRAINNWDVNAKNGTPSIGLMQTIQPTFDRWKEPGFGDIWDPVHNLLASINYVMGTYGSLRAGWGRAGGYALGGIVGQSYGSVMGGPRPSKPTGSMTNAPYLYDKGGVLPPGLSQVVNLTKQPEHIYTKGQSEALQQLAARQAQAGTGGDQWNVMLPHDASVTELMDAVGFQRRVAARGGARRAVPVR